MIDCISDGVDSGRNAAYTYDPLGRIASAVTNGSTNYPKWGLSWAYDRYGNRLNQTVTAGSAYSNTLSFANPGGAQTNQPGGMCFDASGNMLAESACPPSSAPNYTYDAEDRMVTYTGTSATAGYIYDDHGHRVEKCLPNCTSPTSTTVYIFSGGKDIAEYGNGAPPASPSAEYIYSGGTLISTLTSTSTTYHHSDHLSVRVSTGTTGAVVGQQGHYPYGEVWCTANSTTKFIFTSYERDSESGTPNGNDYALGRYYRVAFGRFSSADPVLGIPGDPQTWNRYVYVRDNPVNLTDPSGLSWLSSFFQALINFFYGLNLGQSSGTPPLVTSSSSDNPWTELDNVLTTPAQLPSGLIIENYHVDDQGYGVGDFDGEQNTTCITNPSVVCTYWNDFTKEWDQNSHTPADRMADKLAKYVGEETAPFTEAVNCYAAAALPFLPAVKPEDVENWTGLADSGVDLSADAADSQSEQLLEDADKLKK